MQTVTVTRTLINGNFSTIESATAPLPDDLDLDYLTEIKRRQVLADALFSTLPSVRPKQIPPCPPTNLPN